jgi:hypothetical protein
MKLLYLFGNFAVITLVALSLVEIPAATAQAVISNETLVTTTFVVNKRAATAQMRCNRLPCNKIHVRLYSHHLSDRRRKDLHLPYLARHGDLNRVPMRRSS